MTDRVPGAPGQYILTVSAAEAQKILTGEPVTITLKRDDQPLVEGTPYNKASVLPDELAAILCAGISDPTPADAYLGLLKKTYPYNYAHNSDLTQFIAQAGIGGNHGTHAYAGDRWILDSGTVTGDAREDGNGYTNITLNGTIRQIVANAPDAGTAAIEMVSGTADISYANGEITITSNGGVIKNVRLFKGQYTADNMPAYQPKGYGAELMECKRYYYQSWTGGISIEGSIIVEAITQYRCSNVLLPTEMRILPTIKLYTYENKSGHIKLWGSKDVAAFAVYVNNKSFMPTSGDTAALTIGSNYSLHYTASADL